MSMPTYGEMRSRTERIADEILKTRILAGLEVLKEQYGEDWVEEIDCETLDLSSPTLCVLGQVCGDYEEGVELLAGEYDIDWSIDHGFATEGTREEWYKLNESWHAVLCDKEAIPGTEA